MFRIIPVAAACAAFVRPAAALAHHSAKVIRHTAPLTDVVWGNPHGSTKVACQGRSWDVTLAPVLRMESRGLTREMLGPGKRVRLEGSPRIDGAAEMGIERVIVDGKTVELR